MPEQAAQGARAAHAMPLVAQAARCQRNGVSRIAGLGHRLIGRCQHPRPAVRRGEATVFVKPGLAVGVARKEGPLLRLRQGGVAQAGDVEVAAAGAFAVFVPNRLGRLVRKEGGAIGVAGGQSSGQASRKVHRDGPVVAGLARRWHGRPHAADAALAVGDRAVLFPPGGGRQQQIGMGGGGGVCVRLLHDDELAAFQGPAHGGLVGQRLGWVGAGNPQGPHGPVGGRFEHLDGAQAGLGRHLRHAPQCGHLGAVRRVAQVAVGRQQVGQAAHLAPAHGVGLPGQRERPRTAAANLAGGQVQVDQRGVLVGAAVALVQALAVQRQGGGVATKPACGLHDVVFLQAADGGHVPRGVLAHPVAQGFKAGGVGLDVGRVTQALPQHQVQHAVEQGHVGARQQGQVQIGHFRGLGAPRVGHDQLERRVGPSGVLQAAKQNRVRPGGVGTGDEHRLRVVDVLVARGGRVGPQGGLVPGHRAAHAQPRVGVDVVGAEQALGQFVEDVVVLGEQLA